MTGGGPLGQRTAPAPASRPAPGPDIWKVPPKGTSAKPAVKPQIPSGGSKLLQGIGTLASLKNLTPAGVAAAVMAPRPTGDATLTGALKRGDYTPMQGPPAPKAPEAKAEVQTKTKTEPVKRKIVPPVKQPEKPKPVDPRLQKYRELIKQGRHETARNLGRQIHADRYGIPTTPTRKTA